MKFVKSFLLCASMAVVAMTASTQAQDTQCMFEESLGESQIGSCSAACSCVAVAEPNVTESIPEDNVAVAFALVTGAGLSTTIGAAAVFCDKLVVLHNRKLLAMSLGFSAGVMLLVSLVEIIIKSQGAFTDCKCLWPGEDADDVDHENAGFSMAVICFFIGVIITYTLDCCVHAINHRRGGGHSHGIDQLEEQSQVNAQDVEANPDALMDTRNKKECCEKCSESKPGSSTSIDENVTGETARDIPICMCDVDIAQVLESHNGVAKDGSIVKPEKDEKLEHMSLMTAAAIALHNFPEGLATFVAALADPSVGGALAVAIAIHNIPEGLCISIPVYYSSGSRWRGFWLAFWSGVTEIIGAAIGYFFLREVFGDLAYGVLFGIVAGMMVAICLKELIPTAHRYDPSDSVVTTSILVGMLVMAVSLVLFRL